MLCLSARFPQRSVLCQIKRTNRKRDKSLPFGLGACCSCQLSSHWLEASDCENTVRLRFVPLCSTPSICDYGGTSPPVAPLRELGPNARNMLGVLKDR